MKEVALKITNNLSKTLWLQQKEYKYSIVENTDLSIILKLEDESLLVLEKCDPIYLINREVSNSTLTHNNETYQIISIKHIDDYLDLIIKQI